MKINKRQFGVTVLCASAIMVSSCGVLKSVSPKNENKNVPAGFTSSQDTANYADLKYNQYFQDPNLVALIDTALRNNQELNITLQEITMLNNEVMAKRGEYLPQVSAGLAAGVDKTGLYTVRGASEKANEIAPGKETPEAVPDIMLGAKASWEVDIWHKLRNAKQGAYQRYLSSVEGRNFLITNLVAEIANEYYELLALDNELKIVKQNIEIQTNALEIVRLEKDATRVTELAVKKFEAEVYHTKSLQYEIQQKIVESENHINYLVGRFPQPIVRTDATFDNVNLDKVDAGVPSQLLANRADIRQAEMNLEATKFDLKSAKAQFYPSFTIRAGAGFQAFNPTFLLKTPESLIYSLAGDLMAPLVNRAQIKATYFNANAKQVQAAYEYERTILNAYVEVANQVSNIDNLKQSYALQTNQVSALNESVEIATNLFTSARADYMEVLLTQRDALASKFELIETKREMFHARVNIYRALGGGWK